MQLWYCAQTHRNCEFLACRELQRQHFPQVFCPTEEVAQRRAGVVLGTRTVPLFRSYLFVKFNVQVDYWRPIGSTYGIKRLFSSNPLSPTPVPTETIESLLAAQHGVNSSNEIVLTVEPATPLRAGESATVRSGSFKHHVGICDWAEAARAALWLDIMGGRVKVIFNLSNLEPV